MNMNQAKEFYDKIKPLTPMDFYSLGIPVDNFKTVETLEDLKKSPTNIIICECIKYIEFIQNNFRKQKLLKKEKYVMSTSVFAQLHFDKRTNLEILKPSPIQFKKVYKPYSGQNLDDKTLLVFRQGGIGDLLFIQPNLIYLKEKYLLQIELLKMQEWIKENKKKILIICEGRDSAGKGSTIKRFVEHLNPKNYRVETFGVPTDYEKEHWFDRYTKVLPKEGEIVFFDRSYYNRAVTEPAMGYCTEEQYLKFMSEVNSYEEDLINKGYYIFKFWFSITKEKQLQRFELRKASALKYWKYSPNDAASVSKWDVLTKFKDQMFAQTSTDIAPWTIIDSNDKRSAQLNAIRTVLNEIPYSDNKNQKVLKTYKEVVYEV